MTPCYVLLRGKELAVGERAAAESLEDPEHTIDQLKQYFGRKEIPRALGDRHYPPEAIAGLILKRLVNDARLRLGHFEDVVISVPASFDENRRRATQDAGYVAGLNVVGLISEPTAAAVALAHQQGYLGPKSNVIVPQNVVVLNMGAAATDVAVYTIQGSTISARSTTGDDQLGGRRWDHRLVDFAAESLAPEFGVDLRLEPRGAARLWQQCEAVKCGLSDITEATIEVEWEGRTARATIPRSYLEELTEDLVDRVRTIVLETIRASGLTRSHIDRILLAGGATRMPALRRAMTDLLGPETKVSQSPDEAVACGAALYAGRRLSERRKEEPKYKLEEVAPYSLGLVGTSRKTGQQSSRVIVPRNCRLPASVKCTLRTQRGNQESLSLQFVRGESESVEECRPIGRWVLKNLPANLPAGSPITVAVQFGEDGRIRVVADTADHGIHATRIMTQESGLTRDELDQWREWVDLTYHGYHAIG
jgi:molecular chaperone DnaK